MGSTNSNGPSSAHSDGTRHPASGQPESDVDLPGVSRRNFLRGGLAVGAVAGLSASSLFALHASAHARTMDPGLTVPPAGSRPQGQAFWPSRWGPNDQVGATNWITPAKIRWAARMIRTGNVYEMGQVYQQGMPLFGTRKFDMTIPGYPNPSGGAPLGQNGLVFNDELLTAEIGQVGTQFDGLGHIGIAMNGEDTSEMYYYNGWTHADIAGRNGLRALGIENVRPIFTRGILIDVAGLHGGMLEAGYQITVNDVTRALARQRMNRKSFTSGDAYFFNTGWSQLWMVDNEAYNAGAPGIGLDVAQWLISMDAVVAGADTWPLEVVPNPDPNLAFPVHQELIAKNGIHIHENLNFDSLLADGVYEFVYNMLPLRMLGATGSPGRPIAMT